MARAITPTGPGLNDANGVYLGQLLSATYSPSASERTIHYTTYLPAVDGVLQFASNNNTIGTSSLFENFPDGIYYNQPDCQGNAYVDAVNGEPWIHPWIVESADGRFYKVGSTTLSSTSVQSVDQLGNGCLSLGTTISAHRLKPVTLPFDPNSVVLPYKITQ